ncbi:MAG: hypothetical protein P9L93_04290 [Candidatus Gorgyraea atricola]|nr:hypothetical protein [Candidatus Gorgyraea atricola]
MRIGKLISTLIIMTFLWQNVAFCSIERKFVLRIPLRGTKLIEKVITKKERAKSRVGKYISTITQKAGGFFEKKSKKKGLDLSDPYAEFFSQNMDLTGKILLEIVRELDRNPLIYKELTFELAALMLKLDVNIANLVFFGYSLDIHCYEDYRELMPIFGLALVLVSHFNPETDIFTNPMDSAGNWNDPKRNVNRIIGFLREEKRAIRFVEIFEADRDDKGQPWFIDSQIAILDALEAIDYKTPAILKKVKTRLNKLTTDSSMSDIVKERLKEVIAVLEEGGKKSLYNELYEQAIREFEIYKDSVEIEDLSIIKMIKHIKSNIKKGNFGFFEREDLEAYFGDLGKRRDPVDIYEAGSAYKKNEAKLKKEIDLVRIDYDKAIEFLSKAENFENVKKMLEVLVQQRIASQKL